MIAEAEVVSQLVDDGVAHLTPHLSVRARHAQDRTSKDGNLIGERRRDAEDAEELVAFVDQVPVVVARLVLDDDGDVLDEFREAVGQLVECFFDELPEFIR